jgi:hypothetical protein
MGEASPVPQHKDENDRSKSFFKAVVEAKHMIHKYSGEKK